MFLGHGGEAFDYVACLNASAAHVAALADVVLQHTQGWPEVSGVGPSAAPQNSSVDRALALARTLIGGALPCHSDDSSKSASRRRTWRHRSPSTNRSGSRRPTSAKPCLTRMPSSRMAASASACTSASRPPARR
jgi:hypothetical protein